MASTPRSNRPPDGRKAGATWVAATGAFLLLAAAAVFVAVRWDQLPEEAKVALIGALTGGSLLGGRALRRSLPATGGVLFHLGALLVPVDVAALGLRLHLGWRALLLAEGLVGAAVLGGLAATAGSVVLTAAAGASVVVLAAGIAAVSPVPAPLVLAAAAAAAHLLHRRRLAVAWAGLAGLAPLLGALATALLRVRSAQAAAVLEELGLGGHRAALLAVASGAVAATVLGREAARRRDLALVALAGACVASGAATTGVNADLSRSATFLAAGALFVVVEAAAMVGQRDAFWGRPAKAAALAGEGLAAVLGTPVAGVLLLAAPLVEDGLDLFGDAPPWKPQPAAGLAWALLAGGWLLAAWRRQAPQRSPWAALRAAVADDRTVVFLAAAAGAATVVGSASTLAVGVALVALAAGLAASRGIVATALAVAAALWAPFVVSSAHPLASMPIGLAAAGALGLAAVRWRGTAGGWPSTGLAAVGSLAAFSSCVLARGAAGTTTAMLVAVASIWLLSLVVERACPMAGHTVRATMLLGVLGAVAGPSVACSSACGAGRVLPVAAAATLLFVLDAVRHDEPLIALGASLAVQVVVASAAMAAGVDLATVGMLLCASAVVHSGLSAPYPARWRLPFVAAAAAGLLAGLPLAAGDGARFAEGLILAGGLAVVAGLLLRDGLVGHAGGAVVVSGIALHLAVDGVAALEAFAAPVAVQLLVAGWQLRRQGGRGPAAETVSSWTAYGPAIALLGGAGLVERLSGGPAWHALVAGAVGAAAVAAGGWRRLAGPLFLGTGLVVAVTVLESLATLAGVPTWAWLAAGGAALLATGVALERAATSPAEAGRRLVDVVDERFS